MRDHGPSSSTGLSVGISAVTIGDRKRHARIIAAAVLIDLPAARNLVGHAVRDIMARVGLRGSRNALGETGGLACAKQQASHPLSTGATPSLH
jgi:hypothetical protein